jgi:hypothetical protein
MIKCVYPTFIIQNLDVVTLELGMKVCDLWKYYFSLIDYVQFAKFGQIGHTKILVIH